jgi:hypothetical protein
MVRVVGVPWVIGSRTGLVSPSICDIQPVLQSPRTALRRREAIFFVDQVFWRFSIGVTLPN